MRTLGYERGDLAAAAVAAAFTLVTVLVSAREGSTIGVGSLLLFAFFCLTVVGWLTAPHLVVALMIPLFAALPTLKVLFIPTIGPIKDLITLAAAVALLVTVLQHRRGRDLPPFDRRLVLLIGAFMGLYVVNLGGGLSSGQHNIAWAQGVRLAGEPMILLLAGLLLPSPRRTLDWAVRSFVFTGVGVALYGIYQQYLGGWGLVGLGYSFGDQVRSIGHYLRSFGSLDDPFAYAAFLLLALAAVLFGMKPGPLKLACISVISLGIVFSYVRTAAVIGVALIAMMMIRSGRTTIAILLFGVSLASALVLLFAVAGASQTRSVRAGPGLYLTLNGRTKVWSTLFAKPSAVPFGFGVGKIGTAAERARYGLTRKTENEPKAAYTAVDSAYFATVADVGLVGLAIFLALLSRLIVLAIAATKVPGSRKWLALGWMIAILIDAVTRESFTGFPTAFIGMLVVGLALADAASASQARGARVDERTAGVGCEF
jgi:O-Antigen ligase